jgi:hypothetical protein
VRRVGANWPPDLLYYHPADGARIVMFTPIDTDAGESTKGRLIPKAANDAGLERFA